MRPHDKKPIGEYRASGLPSGETLLDTFDCFVAVQADTIACI